MRLLDQGAGSLDRVDLAVLNDHGSVVARSPPSQRYHSTNSARTPCATRITDIRTSKPHHLLPRTVATVPQATDVSSRKMYGTKHPLLSFVINF